MFTLSEIEWALYDEPYEEDPATDDRTMNQLVSTVSGIDLDYDSMEVSQQNNPSGKHYTWLLLYGKQWLQIENDHIIECNYCQPGAKGINIDTHLGSIYIDFDTMTVRRSSADFAVQRVPSLSHNQREDMGWYYRDDSNWYEYGVQGSNSSTSSVSSQDLEKHYNSNRRGNFQFSTGKYSYTVDFSAMMQTNLSTHRQRKMRRRPKFKSVVCVNNSLNTFEQFTSTTNPFPSAASYANSSTAVTWQYMGNEGIWTDYNKTDSSLDSTDIERQYQRNPQGQLAFRAGPYNYTLYFNGMYQINMTYKTKRAVQRICADANDSSTLCQVCWQFKDMDNCWKDFVKGKGKGQCTISSQELERQYQQNKAGIVTYSSKKFSYKLDFSKMIQTNLSTGTQRPVRRN